VQFQEPPFVDSEGGFGGRIAPEPERVTTTTQLPPTLTSSALADQAPASAITAAPAAAFKNVLMLVSPFSWF
jgi:hypothetical protein